MTTLTGRAGLALLLLLSACGSGDGPAPAPGGSALRLSGTTLAFSAAAGGADPAAQSVTATNAGDGALAAPTAAVTYQSGAGWITSVQVSGAAAPYQVTVQVSVSGLAAGTYAATVTLSSAGARQSPQLVAVALTVSMAQPAAHAPSMSLSPKSHDWYARSNSGRDYGPMTSTLTAFGDGQLPRPTASVRDETLAGWIRSVEVTGDAPPYTVSIQPASAALPAGDYHATVRLELPGAPNSPLAVPVRLRIVTPRLLATPAALLLAASPGGAAPAAQVVTVSEYSSFTLQPLEVTVATGAGPAGWLTAGTTATAGQVTIQADHGALAAGTCQGTVRIGSPGLADAPVEVPVTLVVAAPTSTSLALSASSVTLRAKQGGAAAAQVITASRSGTGALGKPVVVVSEVGAGGWLTATVSGSAYPYAITLQAASAALPPGRRFAEVSVAAPGAANGPLTIPVELQVTRHLTLTEDCTAWGEDGTRVTEPCGTVLGASGWSPGFPTSYSFNLQEEGPGVWGADAPVYYYELTVIRAGPTSQRVRTLEGAVDMGRDRGGRAEASYAFPSGPTPVTFDLSGLSPWQAAADSVRLTSWNMGGTHAVAPTLAADATSLSLGLDLDALGFPLPVAADDVHLTQLRQAPTPAGGGSYLRVVAAGEAGGRAVLDRQPVTVASALAAPAQGPALTTDWRHGQFEAALPPGAGTLPPVHSLSVLAAPAPLTSPSPFRRGAPVTLLDLSVDGSTPVADADYGPLPVPQFLPPRYRPYRFAGLVKPVARAAKGAAPVDFLSYVVRYDDLATATGPIGPLVTGVTTFTIDGQDAFGPLTITRGLPYLLWSSPRLGSVTSYRLTLYELTNVAGITRVTTVWEQINTGGGQTIGVSSGHTYVLGLEAVSSPGAVWLGGSPYREGVPYGAAMVYSSVISP